MKKKLFSIVVVLSLVAGLATASARAQTVMEWMTLSRSLISDYALPAISGTWPTTESRCQESSTLVIKAGQESSNSRDCGIDGNYYSVFGFEPQPIAAAP